MDELDATALRFHTEMDVLDGQTRVQACIAYSDLLEADQQLYKGATPELCAIIVEETLFHPQGGGQPSDVGEMVINGSVFDVLSARTAASRAGVVLHFGIFKDGRPSSLPTGSCTQSVNVEKRLLYSKYHTAGHVLGSAVRHLLEKKVPGFDELKASHFPDSASCEFAGLIAGTYKEAVQQKLDEFIAAAMPVEIEFWSEEDFHREGVARLLPDEATREAMGVKPGEKFRVVKIVGAEVYPCGGTHVHTTDQCGKTVVKKISRSKGTSRVSYTLSGA